MLSNHVKLWSKEWGKVFNHWQGIGCPRLINVWSEWRLSYRVNRKATVAWITDSFKSKWKECIIIWSSLNTGLCNCKPIRVTMLKKKKMSIIKSIFSGHASIKNEFCINERRLPGLMRLIFPLNKGDSWVCVHCYPLWENKLVVVAWWLKRYPVRKHPVLSFVWKVLVHVLPN